MNLFIDNNYDLFVNFGNYITKSRFRTLLMVAIVYKSQDML